MKKLAFLLLFLILIILSLVWIVPIGYGDYFIYKYKIYKKDGRSYEVFHVVEGCKTRVKLTSFILQSDIDAVSGIGSSCGKLSVSQIGNDVSTIVELYDLKDQVTRSNGIEISIRENFVMFPNFMRFLNAEKKWPIDFFNKNKRKNVKVIHEDYKRLLHQLLISGGIYKPVFQLFKDLGCNVHLKGKNHFLEYHSSGGLPEMMSKNDLIKNGVINEKDASKEYYPVLEKLIYKVDCKKGVYNLNQIR